MSVNIHKILEEPDSKVTYSHDLIFDEETMGILKHKDYRYIRVMIEILLRGNDDRLIKQETYQTVIAELQEAVNSKLFNGYNFFAQLGNIASEDD